MTIKIEPHSFELSSPFTITGYTFTHANTIRVIIEKDGFIGRGEAIGIYYEDETPKSMAKAIRDIMDQRLTRETIQETLPRGGARNALDCAFWDHECKSKGRNIWQLLNMSPKPLSTVATVGIDDADNMALRAKSFARYPNLKIKLDNDNPIEKLEVIRLARPDATLIIDVNQGWTYDELKSYAPACARLGIAMIEQPLPRGEDDILEGYNSPVPLGADESCLDLSEYETAAKKYDVINIKLDKCGGLTEAIEIAKRAKRDDKKLMVGNMTGSSLSMAPAYVIGQVCHYVDLDGPLFLQEDVENGLTYNDGGIVSIPRPDLWG